MLRPIFTWVTLLLTLFSGVAIGWYANRLVEAIRRAPTVTETDTDQIHGM